MCTWWGQKVAGADANRRLIWTPLKNDFDQPERRARRRKTDGWLNVSSTSQFFVRSLFCLSQYMSTVYANASRSPISNSHVHDIMWKAKISELLTWLIYVQPILFQKEWYQFSYNWRKLSYFVIIMNVLVSFFRFIWIPLLWVYGHFKYFTVIG